MQIGLYTGASGGLAQTRLLELVGNNLANVNTVGYKAERIVNRQQEFSDTLASKINTTPESARADQQRSPGVVTIGTATDFSAGPVRDTGNPLNAALTEEGHFFVVDTPQGEAYTRAGNFTLNAERQLVTPDGFPVLGTGGAITLPPEGKISISKNGTITSQNEAGLTTISNLKVVNIADTENLERTEGARFRLGQGGVAEDVTPSLVPGAVEMPNVNVVDSMVQMIAAQRGFEMYTKTVKTQEELTETSLRTNRA